MDNLRQNKVARMLQKELSVYFQRNAGLYGRNAIITTTQVRISPDLSICRVYLSIFIGDNSISREFVLNEIQKSTKKIRYEIGLNIKNQVRVIPEFTYFLDDTLDYVEKIDKLLKQ